MALNGRFISFKPIIEAVYRRAGFQSIDWGEAIEIIGETIRRIGALPAYKDVTTNGIGTNPVPLEVQDYRVILPTDLMVLRGIRKVSLQTIDGTLRITGIHPMYENTDLFYKTNNHQLDDGIPVGSYTYEQFKQTDNVLLSGTSGTASIVCAGLTKTVTFATDLETTASNFVTANLIAFANINIELTSSGDTITFKATQSGVPYDSPVITNTSGDLTGAITSGTATDPVQVYGPSYSNSQNYSYQYKVDNSYIYTNFQEGFIEISYKGFVIDEHGFPMIPDDQRFIDAITWSITEHILYKKFMVGEVSDKVYHHADAQKDWYVASARSKANIPSLQTMESIKNMFVRTIVKQNDYGTSFKYAGMQEQRYTSNSKYRSF